ncbi:MAG TPA: substrate-binding domain-containing protein [Acidimicrobiia bacterium]|jgi:tungstate transport system substrate-binding protein
MRALGIVGALVLAVACGGNRALLIAAGTTLVDSGFIESVADAYTVETGVDVDVIGEATAQVLALARSGSVDVTLTHAPDLEAEFETDGLASRSAIVFTSRFIVAGPPGADLTGSDAVEAFRQIAQAEGPFVGRQDGSGTALVESVIWDLAGVDGPGQPWYVSTGQGMGLTLQVASERAAYVLAEFGTFLSTGSLALVDTGVSDPILENPYRVMSVAGTESVDAADEFVAWLSSADGRRAIEQASRVVFDRADVYQLP